MITEEIVQAVLVYRWNEIYRWNQERCTVLRNLGTIDFLIRIVMGEGLMIGACFAPGVWRWMAAPGAMLMLTAALAYFSIDIESGHSFLTNAHQNSDKRRHLG